MVGTNKILLSLILFLLLSACSSITLKGLYRLSQLDPLTTDPAQIRVAIRTDKSIQVKDGSAHIKFTYKSDDSTLTIDDTFYVQQTSHDKNTSQLFDETKKTDYITVLSLTAKDAKKLQYNQQQILAHKEKNIKGTGSLGLELNNFCLPKPLPKRALTVDVFLQTDNIEGFFPFLTEVDVKEQAAKREEKGEITNACKNNAQ